MVLDDLKYSGKVCKNRISNSGEQTKIEITNPEEIAIKQAPEKSAASQEFLLLASMEKFRGFKSVEEFLQDTDELICDFSPEWPCKWAPLGDNVYTIDGALNADTWAEKTGTDLLPALPAGFLKHGSRGIRSSVVPCQIGNGQVEFGVRKRL